MSNVDRSAGTRTAVVTGVAGFIGSALAHRLVADGWDVRGIDDGRTGDWSRVPNAVELTRDDLGTLPDADLDAVCSGATVLFHLAAEKYNTPGSTPSRVLDANVIATERLYRRAAHAGVDKIVFTSSLYAYGARGPAAMREQDVPHPETVYGVSKLAGEHLLRAVARDHALRWTVGRLFFVYGPRQYAEGGYKSVIMRNFERIAAGSQPVVNGDGRQSLDYVYIGDCIDALVRLTATDADGGTFNVCSGHGVTVTDLTQAMLSISRSTFEPAPGAADETHGSRRVGDPTHIAGSLGWSASTPLDAGLTAVWRWLTEGR